MIQIQNEKSCNDSILSKLKKNEIFFASRVGGIESVIISSFINKIPYSESIRYGACNNAGIYPIDDRSLDNFSINYINSMRDIDLLGYWDTGIDKILGTYLPNSELYDLPGLEPYYFPENPWSQYLLDKKVLVIHPFAESIKDQYKKRENLFLSTNILPKFELIVLKAEQNVGDYNSDYFKSLRKMKDQIQNIEFDVALIGCGAFGIPLGSYIKTEKKKTVIHLGGALQIFFGILGQRWVTNERIMRFHNENWTRPKISERTQNFNLIEGGCYW